MRFHQYKLHNITYSFTGYYKLANCILNNRKLAGRKVSIAMIYIYVTVCILEVGRCRYFTSVSVFGFLVGFIKVGSVFGIGF